MRGKAESRDALERAMGQGNQIRKRRKKKKEERLGKLLKGIYEGGGRGKRGKGKARGLRDASQEKAS